MCVICTCVCLCMFASHCSSVFFCRGRVSDIFFPERTDLSGKRCFQERKKLAPGGACGKQRVFSPEAAVRHSGYRCVREIVSVSGKKSGKPAESFCLILFFGAGIVLFSRKTWAGSLQEEGLRSPYPFPLCVKRRT